MNRLKAWLDEPFNPVAVLLGVLVAAIRTPWEWVRGQR
jgi:hypothetical protein